MGSIPAPDFWLPISAMAKYASRYTGFKNPPVDTGTTWHLMSTSRRSLMR
jgi:hypothetical protein